MKKLLLILSVFVVTFSSAFAAELNPFAYGLKSSVNASNPMLLDIQFSINAPATSVKVVVYDIATKADVYTYSCTAYNEKHDYAFSLDLSNIPGQYRGGVDNLGWRVDVKGAAVGKDLDLVSNSVKLYSPTSIDVDNNPQNENFGTVFVVEGLPNAKDNATYASYLSYNDGAGLYLLNADGTARPMPNRPAGKYGYNGGRVQQARQYFNGNASGGYSPYRVRVSDDGRIFISSMTPDGEVLWEADPLVFSRPDAPDWETRAVAGWSHVMSAKNANTVLGTAKRNCSHTHCGIYHLYKGTTEGPFIAGPNLGFDVKGSGKDLKLLMLAGCKEAIVVMTPAHFYCDEYDLGEAKIWETSPSRRIFAGNVVNYAGVQVQYDKDGNVWMCQHRGGTDAATLMKFNGTATNAVLYDENPRKPYHRCGAIRFNQDFTKVAIASIGDGGGGAVTIYPVEDGMPIWAQGVEVDIKSTTHVSHMDYAWDYADNLYVVADAASGTAGRCVAVYATKRSADEVVSTPAASRFAFEVNCASDESYLINVVTADANQGSATITAGFDAEGKVPSCTPVEVFAQSNDGYKFVCWKEGDDVEVSRENPYTFSAVKDITLTAHFEVGNYTVTWWNLFKNGEDIGQESTAYPGTNERLWRLYQIEFEKYNTSKSGAAMRWHYDTHKPDGASKTQFNVGTFVYYDDRGPNNKDFLTSSTTNTTTPFAWLGKYIEDVSGTESSETAHWQYVIYLFFNRTNKAYNASEYDCTVNVTWTDNTKSFAKDYGMPEYWRPWWTEAVCNLEKTISSETSMPVTWNQDITCAAGDVATFGKFNGTAPTSNKETQPSLWYQWNTISDPNDEYILAWRDGSKTGRIVHNVYRDNMELHVSYVKKHLEENDPIVKQPNEAGYDPDDATNNDVLQLLRNPNFGAIPQHKLTMTRNITAGMYNTICLPFELTTLVGTPYDGAQILQINTTTTEDEVLKINFTPLTVSEATPMKAGVPYLIQKPTDITGPQAFDVAKFPAIEAYETNYALNEHGGVSVDVGAITFHGVINPTDIPQGSIILVANNRLAEVTETGQMAGFRGYFTWNDPVRKAPSRMEITVGKQVTTDVEEIVDDQIIQPAAPKVRKVMYDGQIYILRGDEVYSITGNRVK